MIRIFKSPNIPTKLTVDGVIARNALCATYLANPNLYRIKYNAKTNPHKLEVNAAIYGDPVVKNQLMADQHGKCCFCEGTFSEHAFGDVEHYRPKGGYQQVDTDPLSKPGYYWLAYEWDNLMFSCDVCNRSHKKNLFPLTTGTARAVEHTDPLEPAQDCLLINPNSEYPDQHITFNEHAPIGHTPKGRTSISVYGLNRPKLIEARMKHLAVVEKNISLANIPFGELSYATINQLMNVLHVTTVAEVQDVFNTAAQFIGDCAKNEAKFANMVRSNYPQLPQI